MSGIMVRGAWGTIYWTIRVFGTCIFYGRNPEPHILEESKMADCGCLQSAEASPKC